MTKKSTKRALLLSGLALLLCVSMLVGSTFAWFTDSVTSGNNKIIAGNLKIDLELWNGTEYVSIKENSDPIFGTAALATNSLNTLWEPGKTQVAYLRLVNDGSLALKYTVGLDVTNVSKDLYEVMQYAITPDAQNGDVTAWSAADGKAVVPGTQAVTAAPVVMNPGDVHYFALSVHMLESAGNDYQNGEVDFDLTVLATQVDVESDSFGPDYDAGLEFSKNGISKTLDDGSVVLYGDDGVVSLISLPEDLGDEYVVPAGVTNLGAALAGKTLDKLTIPASVTYARKSLMGITVKEVVLEDGVTEIPDRMFYQANIENVVIPDSVTVIRENAFSMSGAKTVTVPASVTTIEEGAFQSMTNLETVTIEGDVAIEAYAFRGCGALRTVTLNGEDVTFVKSTVHGYNSMWFCNGQSNNPGTSTIDFYVKNSTVAANLRTALGAELREDTPIYVNGKLDASSLPAVGTDAEQLTWSQISAIGAAGLADQYFDLGDTKTITLSDNTEIVMEIVAFNADTAVDGTVAPITWLSKNVVAMRSMNNVKTAENYGSNAGGWGATELRTWLQSDYYNTLPQDVKDAIITVQKKSRLSQKEWTNNNNVKDAVTEDTLWIPSISEINPNDVSKEDNATEYYEYFTNADMFERYTRYDLNGEQVFWWLRSSATTTAFGKFHIAKSATVDFNGYIFNDVGTSGDEFSYNECGIVFGFCS